MTTYKNLGDISISADANKINKNYFNFLVEINNWAKLNEKRIQISDGYYNYSKKYIDGGMILILDLSDQQINDIQEKAESCGITRLDYIFDVTNNEKAKS